MNVVTDTHPWVWFLTANPRLSAKARAILSDSSNLIIIPLIVMLEIKYLYSRKRIAVSYQQALERVETTENILLYPLDISVVANSPPLLNIHDGIIVGTAISLSQELNQPVPLVTIDEAITASGLVPVLW